MKISCVLPTYQRGSIIKHALNGIIDQTFKDWELIIVDDGSTDNTKQVVNLFIQNDNRIKYFKLPHTGKIGKVRNFGNRKAQGELIVVQDSDDISLPDRFDVLWQEYQNTHADVLYHSMYMLFRDAELDMITRKFNPALPFDKDKILHTQYIPGQLAYKKEVVMKVPYNEEMQVSDDWQILIELALNNYKFHPIPRALYEYWYTNDSVTISGLKNNKRKQDLSLMVDMLRNKYKIDVIHAENFIKDKQGNFIKQEYIK